MTAPRDPTRDEDPPTRDADDRQEARARARLTPEDRDGNVAEWERDARVPPA